MSFLNLVKKAYQIPLLLGYYTSYGIKEKGLQEIPHEELPSLDKQLYIQNFNDLTTMDELNRQEIENF